MKSIIFFSYSRHDSGFALQLGKDLRAAGISIWLDQLDIKTGERWDIAIEQGLAACSRILVILSPAAVASTNVMDEVSYALDESKPVVPVLHSDCDIPFRLRRVQYTDFRTDYQAAFDSLLGYLNVAAAPAVDPRQGPGAAAAFPSRSAPSGDHSPAGSVQMRRTPARANGRLRLIFAATALVLAGTGSYWITRGSPSSKAPPSSDGQSSTHKASPAPPPRDAPSPAETRPVSPTRVHIVNAKSRLCLTPAGGVKDLNAEMVQYICDDDLSRLWSIGPTDDLGFIAIKNLNSGLCLTIAGGSAERNVTAVQYECDGDPSRLWKLRRVDGDVQLVNVHSALCLTVAGGGTERNQPAVQYPCDGDPSRDWRIRRAPGPLSP